MNASCLLSVLIAAHNCEEYLAGTLDSIIASLGSSLDKAEIIIINDASTDGTQAVIEAYAARLPQIRSGNTDFRNVGKVRNRAVELAKGDYILMVDGDDTLLPGALHDRLAVLAQEKPDILLSKIIEVRAGSATPQWQAASPETLTRHDAIERFLIHRDYQAHFIGQFFSRRLFQQHAFPDFICYEDTWLFPQMLTQSEKTLFCRAGFYLYRKHQQSLSSVINDDKIACLIAATRNLDVVLPARYQALITCHWLDVANRYHSQLRGTPEGRDLLARIRGVSLLGFLLNGKVRMSYKRKMLKVRRRGL
ncbi:glycosyltransferase family 2 protein [Erwinia sp. P6884]|uniref:glycosyltransferase family 2 protein n=1 Tax=Erwinia sp. P6884 TaxID=3141450 RepID=UPI00319BFA4B